MNIHINDFWIKVIRIYLDNSSNIILLWSIHLVFYICKVIIKDDEIQKECKFHIFGKVLFKKSFSYIFCGFVLFNLKYFMAQNKNKFEKDIRILYALTGKIFNTINLNIALVYYHFYCIYVFHS